MISIDGKDTGKEVGKFGNLDEILISIMHDEALENRVVTDVFVNKEIFSEIYPHQAEDIDASEIQSVEIVTMPISEMAANITEELYKVMKVMDQGARRVAELFRRAEDGEALEFYQDLLDVIRHFLSMISLLRNEFSLKRHPHFNEATEELSQLFSEMLEVVENEDWILLSDLLEYEFIPAVERFKSVIAQLREDIKDYIKA
ncbi:MAG: hypothetical protein HQK81_09390 [Desulfovibrionaceae bacterium]|nr:hypothetical protein [Desulfovibrionaceae bacterium]MBF0514253.1 hypothetical protein [Desulfovibrionaceae bacterium]